MVTVRHLTWTDRGLAAGLIVFYFAVVAMAVALRGCE